MEIDLEPEQVDLTVDIPVQGGLLFPLHLNQQNLDELHLVAGHFWLEWFPCTDPTKVDAYVDAVTRLIDGTYRILEYRRGSRVVRADLQAPEGRGWRTVGRYEGPSLIPWPPITHFVLQNALPSGAGGVISP